MRRIRSIISDKRRCFLCGSTMNLERHHCIHGHGWRPLADKYGLTVYLCARCHRDWQNGVHGQNKVADLYLKRVAQRAFEEKYGFAEWMKVFGRNYSPHEDFKDALNEYIRSDEIDEQG